MKGYSLMNLSDVVENHKESGPWKVLSLEGEMKWPYHNVMLSCCCPKGHRTTMTWKSWSENQNSICNRCPIPKEIKPEPEKSEKKFRFQTVHVEKAVKIYKGMNGEAQALVV